MTDLSAVFRKRDHKRNYIAMCISEQRKANEQLFWTPYGMLTKPVCTWIVSNDLATYESADIFIADVQMLRNFRDIVQKLKDGLLQHTTNKGLFTMSESDFILTAMRKQVTVSDKVFKGLGAWHDFAESIVLTEAELARGEKYWLASQEILDIRGEADTVFMEDKTAKDSGK